MRKSKKFFAPMILSLLLLPSCGGMEEQNQAEELALTIRGEYLALESLSASMDVTADYGERVYDFALTAAVSGEETVLTLTEPEWAAGLTARITGEEGALEYDGLILETGPLDGEDLSPMSALPQLLEAARSGYMAECSLEEGEQRTFLRVRYADPDQPPGEGRETTLWFDPDTHALVEGEISMDGLRVIRCTISEFTIGS